MKNPFTAIALKKMAERQLLRHHGRRALVGQYVREERDEKGRVVLRDASEVVNYHKSKKFPHSSKRQQLRAQRQR